MYMCMEFDSIDSSKLRNIRMIFREMGGSGKGGKKGDRERERARDIKKQNQRVLNGAV